MKERPALGLWSSAQSIGERQTMHSLRAVLVAVLGAVMPVLGVGAGRCSVQGASEIVSLSGLPAALRTLLPRPERGMDGIADRGSRFNATDVRGNALPSRRFALAAVFGDCAVIAIEYGGIARVFEITEYHLIQGRWNVTSRTSVFREPRTVMDLQSTR
jgi:hypothetical protein